MTERTHISTNAAPIVVESRAQIDGPAMKPRGFWYEVDGDWRRWCSSEMPHWIEGRQLHRVVLGTENILRIASVADLDDFDDAYHVTRRVDGRSYGLGFYDSCDGIRWSEVAATYDGIEIAPYQWTRRLDGHTWYYGWDCASGVIWRPRSVTVELVGPASLVEAVA